MTHAIAPTRYLFENGFVVKRDFVSDLQFHALNHWNTERTVSDIVQAFTKSMSRYALNTMSVPTIMGIAITNIRRAMAASTIYLPGFLNGLDRKSTRLNS